MSEDTADITPEYNSSPNETLEFLYKDYETLKELYRQSDTAVQGLFNFYLTVLSALTAALVIIFQINSSNLVSIAGLLILAIAIGVFYQSGILEKYADKTVYAETINDIRLQILEIIPDKIITPYNLPFRAPGIDHPSKTAIEKWEQRMWWIAPVGTHQLFISFVTSLSLAFLIWVLLFYIELTATRVWQGMIFSFIVFWLGFIANNTYASIKINREIDQQREVITLPLGAEKTANNVTPKDEEIEDSALAEKW